MKRNKRKVRKRPELGGRKSDFRNHSKRSALPLGSSKNSLRSNSFSCRFACLAYATQESKRIPKIVHSLKTSSCGVFSSIPISYLTTSVLRSRRKKDGEPRRGKGSRAIPKHWWRRPVVVINLAPCQRLARGLGSGLKPLLIKKGLGLMEICSHRLQK